MMKDFVTDLIMWSLAAPILFVRWLVSVARSVRFWRVAYQSQIVCGCCKARIFLVGIWRCGCGFTYKGHLLRVCPICGSLPRMVRCFNCHVTEKLPEP